MKKLLKNDDSKKEGFDIYWGQLENLEEKNWYIITSEFFKK